MLAMLYLVLFATMAIGFYAATTTQSQIVGNDARVSRASLAAESGLDFMRYHLGRVSIPPSTPPDRVVHELFNDLSVALDSTGNLKGNTLAISGNTIQVPAGPGAIQLDASGQSRFRATITDWAGEIVLKIEGMDGVSSATRVITMDFTRATRPTSAFSYAVASRGQIVMRKGSVTSVTGVDPSIATMMSALATNPSIDVSGGTIGGGLSIVEDATARVTGGTVAGSSIPRVILSEHVTVVDKPEFPVITTDVYRQYATNAYVPNGSTQQNIIIRAGTNPSFNGGDTVQGVMYIESPNTVTFRGNFNLQGFIVFENKNTSSVNVLDFRGNVSQMPLPSGSEFDPLRATSGVSILGPTASVTMSGSTDSYLRGSTIVGRFNFAGSADIQIEQGTLMTYDEVPGATTFNGQTVKFTSTGAHNLPTTGISYSSFYRANPGSYQEVSP
jgi:hypothetical protein